MERKLHEVNAFLKKLSVEPFDGWMSLSVNTKAAEKTLNLVSLHYDPFFKILLLRWALREQTDQASAPQTAAFHGLDSDHGEEASRHVHATTAATRHPEAEDGPSGELTPRRLTCDSVGWESTAPRMHSILFTVSTEIEGRTEQTRKSHHDQPEATAGVKDLHRPTIMIFIALLCYTKEKEAAREKNKYWTVATTVPSVSQK